VILGSGPTRPSPNPSSLGDSRSRRIRIHSLPGRDLSHFWVVDSAFSINLTACRDDFVTFEPPSGTTRIGGVGVNVHGSCTIRLATPLVSGQIIHRTFHALVTPDVSSRSAQRIGRLLNVSWTQSNFGCEFFFLAYSNIGLPVVPKGMGVLKPSGNGLCLLSHTTSAQGAPHLDTSSVVDSIVAMTAHIDHELWHRRCGHLNMQSLHAQHTHGVPFIPALSVSVRTFSCDSCLLHKASAAPRNPSACPKPPRPLMNLSFEAQ
jgi:hypothetical protein